MEYIYEIGFGCYIIISLLVFNWIRSSYAEKIVHLEDAIRFIKADYEGRINSLKNKLTLPTDKFIIDEKVINENIKTWFYLEDFDIVSIERDTTNEGHTVICYWLDDDHDKIENFYLNISDKLHNQLVDAYMSGKNHVVLQD
jgi:hypothetical protein